MRLQKEIHLQTFNNYTKVKEKSKTYNSTSNVTLYINNINV